MATYLRLKRNPFTPVHPHVNNTRAILRPRRGVAGVPFAPRPFDTVGVRSFIDGFDGIAMQSVIDIGRLGDVGDRYTVLVGARANSLSGSDGLLGTGETFDNIGIVLRPAEQQVRFVIAAGNVNFSALQIHRNQRVEVALAIEITSATEALVSVAIDGVPSPDGPQLVLRDLLQIGTIGNYSDNGNAGGATIYHVQARKTQGAGQFVYQYLMDEGAGEQIFPVADGPIGDILGTPLEQWIWVDEFRLPIAGGLLGHWRADQGIDAPGKEIIAWRDQSGNERTLLDPGAGRRLDLEATPPDFNFRPVAISDGIDDTMATVSFDVPQPFTVIMIFRADAFTQTNLQRLWADGNDDVPNCVYRGDNDNIQLDCGVAGMVLVRSGRIPNSMITTICDGAQSEININTVPEEIDDAGPLGLDNGFRIVNRGAGARCTAGAIAEIMLYGRRLTQSELDTIGAYVQAQYNIVMPGSAQTPAPENLTLVSLPIQVAQLDWDTVGSAGRYAIYRNGVRYRLVLAPATSWLVDDYVAGDAYYVTAFAPGQRESEPSNTVTLP